MSTIGSLVVHRSRARLVSCAFVALATAMSLAPMAIQAVTSPASAAETALPETGWTASTSTNSTGADVPANAIDGNLSTRYSSDAVQASGMYFQVNMGSAQTFNQIEMNSGGSTGHYARGYNVEVSTNGTTFTSVATGTGTSSPETVTFATQTAQYIRVVLTAGGTTSWWSIAEFTVFNGPRAETQLPETGWTASTSTNSTGATSLRTPSTATCPPGTAPTPSRHPACTSRSTWARPRPSTRSR